ncbi:MAG TPA: helix-turn-helix transcriptional regulator [Sphingobacteriaceae bacterium]
MPKFFGAKLHHLRRHYHLTQKELADRLGLASQAYISNVEAGRKTPSLDVIVRLSRLFAVTTDYLLRNTIPPEPLPESSLAETVGEARPTLLGRKLIHLRTQHHFTQRDLAHQLGLLTHAHISHIESGRHEPSADLVVRIADVFAVTTDYLLHDSIAVEIPE